MICPGGSTFAAIASATASPAPDTTVNYRLTGLIAGTPYHVGVTALAESGNESACASASAVARITFAVSPAGTVDFGSVSVGNFADRTFTVTNTAAETVSGTVSTSGPFSIVSGSPFTLAGSGTSQPMTVRFRPTASATATANINFTAEGDTISRVLTGSVADTTLPTVSVTSPTTDAIYTTDNPILTLQGTASSGVIQVTWVNAQSGLEGTASGTTSWRVSGIVLRPGPNVLTVMARDAAGNTGSASLTVMSCRAANDYCR